MLLSQRAWRPRNTTKIKRALYKTNIKSTLVWECGRRRTKSIKNPQGFSLKFETRCSVCYAAFASGAPYATSRSPSPVFFCYVQCFLLVLWRSASSFPSSSIGRRCTKSTKNPPGFSLKFETRRSVCYMAFAAGVSHGACRSPPLRSFPHFSKDYSNFFNGVALGVPRFGSALGLPCALVYTLFQCFFDILLELGRLATLLSLLACAGVG